MGNEKEASAKLSLKTDDAYKGRFEIRTPITGYERMVIDGEIDLYKKSVDIFAEMNEKRFDLNGMMMFENGILVDLKVQTPIPRYENYSLNFKMHANKIFAEVNMPYSMNKIDISYKINKVNDIEFDCTLNQNSWTNS